MACVSMSFQRTLTQQQNSIRHPLRVQIVQLPEQMRPNPRLLPNPLRRKYIRLKQVQIKVLVQRQSHPKSNNETTTLEQRNMSYSHKQAQPSPTQVDRPEPSFSKQIPCDKAKSQPNKYQKRPPDNYANLFTALGDLTGIDNYSSPAGRGKKCCRPTPSPKEEPPSSMIIDEMNTPEVSSQEAPPVIPARSEDIIMPEVQDRETNLDNTMPESEDSALLREGQVPY
ncbi:OLC1v1038891C1 [Oldenlandia corymbosa var. corymbosa]|uniref:OLC1v1038891C1 n=1 Tax=Oldenlandia corymbosa var. corymbosa TaxID=529605 RepID=A0AAV1D1D5_OLDCO|nr:OLC1v1038891C1 [Oldenlandia corymbosa var. corymbosa]